MIHEECGGGGCCGLLRVDVCRLLFVGRCCYGLLFVGGCL